MSVYLFPTTLTPTPLRTPPPPSTRSPQPDSPPMFPLLLHSPVNLFFLQSPSHLVLYPSRPPYWHQGRAGQASRHECVPPIIPPCLSLVFSMLLFLLHALLPACLTLSFFCFTATRRHSFRKRKRNPVNYKHKRKTIIDLTFFVYLLRR